MPMPTEITLTQEEQVAEWSGLEWTALTPYGRWNVGNRVTCQTDFHCYDVRFVPNSESISEIADRNVKLELDAIFMNNEEKPFATLTYTISGDTLSLSLDANISNVIRDPDGTATFTDIDGTVTAFKKETDTFDISVRQTTNNDGTFGLDGDPSTTTNMDAGFDSKVYGTQASFYGKWYFEATDATSTDYGTSSGFHTVTRNFQFEPNASQINQLLPGEVRKSTLTVELLRGTDVILTETYSIAIYRADKPNLTIANASAVNEGTTAQYTITADRDPGSSPVTIKFTPSNTIGTNLKTTDSNNMSQPSGESRTDDVTFSPSGAVWTGSLPVETVPILMMEMD